MAKVSMFAVLGRRYPEFNNLSTNHFSELNRMNEIYPIVRKLREDYPEMTILDVKKECLEFLLNHSNHKFVNQFLHVIADDIDWEFLYNDNLTSQLATV